MRTNYISLRTFSKNTDYESHYNLRDVWKINYNGAGVVMTVVDEGLDPTHAELSRSCVSPSLSNFIVNSTGCNLKMKLNHFSILY